MPPTILWFRRDLRLDDQPALQAALALGQPVLPLFIGETEKEWPMGGASRCWLHGAIQNLQAALQGLKSRLILRQGESLPTLLQFIEETKASAIFWNRRYEPAARALDIQIETALRQRGLNIETFESALLFESGTVLSKTSSPYKVFTPFYRACLALPEPALPLNRPKSLPLPFKWPASLKIEDLKLLPRIPWDAGIRNFWNGEDGYTRLKSFLQEPITEYLESRDRPDLPGTSLLSPSLHFGEISPRRLWHEVRESRQKGIQGYLRQILWREFAHHLLFHFPHTPISPLYPKYEGFSWQDNANLLRAWQRGQTGYPIIDAGMRQLWTTGWMHNRVRMLVGSFLVKDLLIPWQRGATWFWDTLVDADLANNTMGWQWVAGCGADAAPFFRIFNPVTQGERFDPSGDYVRQWVPELAKLSSRWIQKPWQAPPADLAKAGIELGKTYPLPIVDHDEARKRALELYRHWRG